MSSTHLKHVDSATRVGSELQTFTLMWTRRRRHSLTTCLYLAAALPLPHHCLTVLLLLSLLPRNTPSAPFSRFKVMSGLTCQERLTTPLHIHVSRTFKVADGGGVLEKLSCLSHPPQTTEAEAQTTESVRAKNLRSFSRGDKEHKKRCTSDSQHACVLGLRTPVCPVSLGPRELCGLRSCTEVGFALRTP